jgi:DNA-binding NtrC family response regulator
VSRGVLVNAPTQGPGKQPCDVALTVLIVDDDHANADSLLRIFEREGVRTLVAHEAKGALELLRGHRVHVILTDLMMPGTTGIELLRAAKQIAPEVEVVLMTAYGTVETAVTAMREGAYDFVEKPLKRHAIVKSVRKAAERGRLLAENQSLKAEIKLLTHREIIGNAPVLRRVIEVASQAAPSTATVLVLGESGTGKELIARFIHERSARARGPFVAVNCAAIPESILESELFGYERGAFTGASTKKDGRFARATAGTLFLDEIGELAPQVQVKLLRVLQEGEYEPLGGHTVRADVRILAATNRDLLTEVKEGRFREDLYYRLNVIAVVAPPLRSRREDVPLLVDHFLALYAAKNGRARLRVAPSALEKMSDYPWPGNVRELENVIERAVVLCRGDELTEADLPDGMVSATRDTEVPITFSVGTTLDEVERRIIRETLKRTRGDKTLAAQLLGISARTIYRRLDGALPSAEGEEGDGGAVGSGP